MRGDLFEKLGRLDEAHTELGRAASPTRNDRQRALLLTRARRGVALQNAVSLSKVK